MGYTTFLVASSICPVASVSRIVSANLRRALHWRWPFAQRHTPACYRSGYLCVVVVVSSFTLHPLFSSFSSSSALPVFGHMHAAHGHPTQLLRQPTQRCRT